MRLEGDWPLFHPVPPALECLSFEGSEIKIIRFNFQFRGWGTSMTMASHQNPPGYQALLEHALRLKQVGHSS